MRAASTEEYAPPRLAPRVSDSRPFPRVSIVMPTYRRARFIGATIRSLLAQQFDDFELLVRDDGKPGDGTEDAVRIASNGDPRVSYHRNETPRRMPGNINSGIEQSRGEYIAICHDHDIFESDYLGALVRLLDRHPTALYAHCGISCIDQHSAHTGVVFVDDWPQLSRGDVWVRRMLKSFHSPVCALSMVRRSAHETHGLYEPRFGFFADVDLWIRLARFGDVAYESRPLIRVRTREDDHPVATNPWPQLAYLFDIHRVHLEQGLHGWERLRQKLQFLARADALFVRTALHELRSTRRIAIGDSAPRLSELAGPLGRVAARIAR